jgi:hypothetical protein
MFRSIMNPLYASILVSLLSGLGLVFILAITPPSQETEVPTDNSKTYTKQPLPEIHPNLEIEQKKEEPLKETTDETFIRLEPSSTPFSLPIEQPDHSTKTIAFNRFSFSPVYDQNTYTDNYYSVQESRLSVKTVSRPMFNEFSFTRIYRPESFHSRQEDIKALDISYSLSQNVSAQVRSSVMDFSTGIQTQRVNMAGIHLSSGKHVSTKFFAGSAAATLPIYHIPNYAYFTDKNYYRNGMNAGNRMFEWQTVVTPSKYFGLETSLYNLNINPNVIDQQGREGAKLSVFFGMRFLLVNIKYNYLTNDLLGSMNSSKASTNTSSDFATLGLTLFLDKDKQYSLYLGNQYHNIATPINTIHTTQVPGSNSFTAMFRGKSEHLLNSTFFVNFRNQSYKDLIFSNIGVYRVPIYSQSSLEYATALGLELNW